MSYYSPLSPPAAKPIRPPTVFPEEIIDVLKPALKHIKHKQLKASVLTILMVGQLARKDRLAFKQGVKPKRMKDVHRQVGFVVAWWIIRDSMSPSQRENFDTEPDTIFARNLRSLQERFNNSTQHP